MKSPCFVVLISLLLFSYLASAATPNTSHPLNVVDVVGGQTIQDVFDFSWWPVSERDFYSVRFSCSSTGDPVNLIDAGIVAAPEDTVLVPLTGCTTCHCTGGGYDCRGCSSNHAVDVTFTDACSRQGCNEAYCKSVVNRCCTVCTQPVCSCNEGGYCN